MHSEDSASLRKARGAFFTPEPVARFIADWAVRSPRDAVLEPSCGEAVFLQQVGRDGRHAGQLVGIEVHGPSAAEARRVLAAEGVRAEVREGDFFASVPGAGYDASVPGAGYDASVPGAGYDASVPGAGYDASVLGAGYDAVVGNPPYVRYQDFGGELRTRARAAALRAGVSLTGLASSWAAFTVHAALHLRPGGRLGLVLPAELLTVNYAADVRRFLMEHFSSVGLVMFVERVFPGVLEEVVLLLADGFDPTGRAHTDHCDVYQVQNAAGLPACEVASSWKPVTRDAKWTASLLPPHALAAFGQLTSGEGFTHLEQWGDTTLGMVTGNNSYFALSPQRVAELELHPAELLPLSPPGSRHLRGLSFSAASRRKLGEAGKPTWLFRPDGEPSGAASRYIRAGAETGVDLAYKCRVRTPWWRVPYLRPADLFLTYMNADTPRITANRARAFHLNSVHGIYLRPALAALGAGSLPIASLNSVTLLGAETVGRAYGGGMLKIEPREADRLPVPSPALVERHAAELALLRPAVAALLRRGRLIDAVASVDTVLLGRALRVGAAELTALREAHAQLTHRRLARGRAGSSDG